MKTIAYIGSWKIPGTKARQSGSSSGVHAYEYNEGKLTFLRDSLAECSVGCMLTAAGNRLFLTNETADLFGAGKGGGGAVYSLLAKPNGELETLGRAPSLGAFPCYLALTMDGKYAVVANHSLSRMYINKTVLDNGEYRVMVERDEPNAVLLEVRENGSFGRALDIVKLAEAGGNYPNSMPHCVFRFPDTDVFAVIDNGADVLHRFTIDRARGKLEIVKNGSLPMDAGSAPRYAALHPSAPYVYIVDEARAKIHAARYDRASGEMRVLQTASLVGDRQPACGEPSAFPARVSPADVLVDPNGRFVYATCRGTSTITTFAIGEDHLLTRRDVTDCGGRHPRSIAIDPEGKRLLCCNLESDCVTVFNIDAFDGTLLEADRLQIPAPGFVRFMSFK